MNIHDLSDDRETEEDQWSLSSARQSQQQLSCASIVLCNDGIECDKRTETLQSTGNACISNIRYSSWN